MPVPKISIVANFYNSEKYIKKLVKSVQDQTFSDWELIAVNDCSPGRDSEILHGLAASDPRIRVIDNKENLGIARAKKVGIDASSGDFITFIDGDDWLEKDAFKVMYDIATTQNAEVVFINSSRSFPFGYKKELRASVTAEDYNRTLSWEEFRDKYYITCFGKHYFVTAYWGKLYRGDIVRNFKYDFPDKKLCSDEDTTYLAHLLPNFKTFYFSDYQGYNWRWGGVTSFNARKYDLLKYSLLSYELRHKALTQLINLHKFKDGQYFLDVEFKNVLRYIIFSIVESLIADKGAAIKQIKDILSRPSAEIARKIIRYDNRYLTDAFVTAIRENDAEKLYELAEAHYKSLWKQRLIRKIFLFFT